MPPPCPSPASGGGDAGAARAKRDRDGAVNEIVPARNIGDYVPMVDGPEKVAGRAKYTAELVAPGLLAGRIFSSPYSHAEIVDVDVSAALRLPGVKAIVTGAACARQGALSRRVGRGGRRRRRRHRQACARPHQAQGARVARPLHLAVGDG